MNRLTLQMVAVVFAFLALDSVSEIVRYFCSHNAGSLAYHTGSVGLFAAASLRFLRSSFRFSAVGLACLTLAIGPASAQCANGRCPVRTPAPAPVFVPPPSVLATAEPVDWFYHGSDRAHVHLYVGESHRGTFDLVNLKFEGEEKIKVFDPPAPPRAGQVAPLVVPDGVNREGMKNDGKNRFYLNGEEADRETVFSAIAGADTLADDSGLPWVTIVADDNKTAKDRAADVRRTGIKARVKGYPAGHASLKDFPRGPAVYIQAANGRLLDSLKTYESADRVKAAFEAATAAYDPAKEPGPGKPYPQPDPPAPPNAGGGKTLSIPTWALVAAGVVLVLVITRRK